MTALFNFLSTIDHDYFWNLVDIVVLLVAIGFNAGYWYTHVNGKKYIRLWIAIILVVAVVLRLLLAFHIYDEPMFIDVFRPWAAIIYLAFCFGPYIDWSTHAIIRRGSKRDQQ